MNYLTNTHEPTRRRIISEGLEDRLGDIYDGLKFTLGGAAFGFAMAATLERFTPLSVEDWQVALGCAVVLGLAAFLHHRR